MDLYEQKDKIVKELSGGNKRKLQLALSMIGNPSILLLDEPTAGIDPQTKLQIQRSIRRILAKRPHTTVVLTTHDMDEATYLVDNAAILTDHGRI